MVEFPFPSRTTSNVADVKCAVKHLIKGLSRKQQREKKSEIHDLVKIALFR